jgi:hypothetical protein
VRRRDLDRLRALALIDADTRVPQLTVDGRRRYAALPLAVAVGARASEPLRPAHLGKRLERRPRR